MEKTNKINNFSLSCLSCGQTSPAGSVFCQHCGQHLQVAPKEDGKIDNPLPVAPNWPKEIKEERDPVKILFWSVAALAMVGIIVAGGYGGYKYKQKKEARTFINQAAADFSKTVGDINQLSTEARIEDQEDNLEGYIKNLQQEKDRVALTLNDLQVAQSNLRKNRSNYLVRATQSLLEQYYDQAEEKVEDYGMLLDYEIIGSQEMAKFLAELEKMKNEVKTIENIQELKKTLTVLRDAIDQANNSLKVVAPPAGLAEVHNKIIQFFEGFSRSLTEVLAAIDQKNQQKFVETTGQLDEYIEDNERMEEIENLETYYYEQQHEKFISLREKADQIKTDLMSYKFSIGADIPPLMIEGW